MQRIKQLEETYVALNLERNILENRMKQREEYRKTYNEIKMQEIKDEITSIEIMKVKCQARNQNLLENIRKCLDDDQG